MEISKWKTLYLQICFLLTSPQTRYKHRLNIRCFKLYGCLVFASQMMLKSGNIWLNALLVTSRFWKLTNYCTGIIGRFEKKNSKYVNERIIVNLIGFFELLIKGTWTARQSEIKLKTWATYLTTGQICIWTNH